MIYYIHEKTILAFMKEVNDAIKKGHRVVGLGISEGFTSYMARIDSDPYDSKWAWKK